MRYSSTNGVNWVFEGQIQPFSVQLNTPTLYLGLAVCSARNLFSMSAQFENYGDFAGYPGAVVGISLPPTNFTVAAGSSSNVSMVATGSLAGVPLPAGELSFVWQRDDGGGNFTNLVTAGVSTAVVGLTTNAVAIGPLFSPDNGAIFRVIVRAPGAADVISSTFTATVTDTAPPTLTSANGAVLPSSQASEVTLIFSENVSAATATDIANYAVTNAAGVRLTVLSATFLSGDPRNILLKLDGVLGTGTSTVGITGVRDLNNLAIANTVRTFRSFLPSTAPVVVEVYQDVGNGNTIAGLTGNALYTAGTPTWICYSNLFGFNVGLAGIQDNYGVKIYSYFVPPTNGNYKFWIRSDDVAQLYMNTNGTDAAGKVLIAENTAFTATYIVGTTPANSITNITLVGGQPYYLEMLGKEATGGDGFSVMWTASTVNTAPAATVFMPTTALAYPEAAAPSTPVVMEIYTGYQNFIPGFNQLAGLASATNYPTGNYVNDVVNYKYIAGVPDVIGYQKYFGVQPGTLGNTRLDNYLGRIQSYFIAPSNGLYRFWLGVDDVAQLYMNTNAVNSTDPAGMVLLGQSANAFVSTASQLVAQNVPLVGGQKYYLMTLWREGGGGDGVRVAVRSQNDTATPPTTEVIPASMLEYPLGVGRAGAVNFTGILPANPTVPDGQSITLTAAGIVGAPMSAAGSVNAAPYGYIWLKNGVRVQENAFTNITGALTMADNGAVYTLVVTNGFSRAERSVTITVLPDATAPTVVSTTGWRYGDGFNLVFSEPVDAASATFLGNYQITGGLAILGATLAPDRKMVSFRTTSQAAGTTYTITINGVKDASSSANLIAASTTTQFSTWAVGGSGFLVELFTNIPNASILDLVGTPKFVNNQPDVIYYTNVFGVGLFNANSLLENYGARISGYFIPTNTSYYRFYVRSDDASQFWMNINATDSANPAGRTMLIHMPNANVNVNDPRAISQPVPLIAGQRYYMEALTKEGGGGDYFQLIFRQTDAAGTSLTGSPVDNTVNENSTIAMLGGAGAPGNPDAITIAQTPPSDVFATENDLVSLTLVANIPLNMVRASSYQWQKFDGAAYTNIPGATAATLNFFAALADDMVPYRVVFSAPGRNNSYDTLLHVTNDVQAPYMISASSLGGYSIGIRFNEPLDVNTGGEFSNYQVNNGANSVLSATIRSVDPRTVILTLQNPVTEDFTLDAFFIGDRASTNNYGDSSVTGTFQNIAGYDTGSPLATGSSFSATNGEISVVAGGADIWGAADQGHFTIGQRSGDFDIWARVDSLLRTSTDTITKAGVVVRDGTNAEAKTLTVLMNPPAALGGRDLVEAGARTNWVPGVSGLTGVWPSSTNVTPARIPNAWVRLKREGFIFRALYSSNGVDWVGFATNFVDFPRTVYVGLGTTAHNNSAAPTVAEYRDVHIPNAPTITTQPSVSPTVAFHGSTSLTVVANNPTDSGPLTYTWRRDGVVVGTGATLSIPDALGVDSGTYQVEVGNDGGSVFSDAVALTVLNGLPVIGSDSLNAMQNIEQVVSAASLLGNDSDPEGSNLVFRTISGILPVTVGTNFNEGNLLGATLFGNASADTNGYIRLHSSTANAAGSLILDELTPGNRVSGFRASFKLRLSEGTLEPADGFSFNFAPDLPISATTPAAAENGGGNGFSFCVDNYRFAPYPAGGTANTSGMKIRFGGVDVAGVQMPTWNRPDFVPVVITLVNGSLTVMVDGTNVFGTVILPSVSSAGRFGFYARDGGQLESAMLDDLGITVYTADTAGGGSVAYASGSGNVTYTNSACSGSDVFYYLVGDGEVGGNVVAPVAVTLTEANPLAPIILTCATNRTYTLYTNSQIALSDLTGELVVTDTCGTPVVTQLPSPGTLLSEGPNVITLTATDAGGLFSTCQITITVVVIRPTISVGGAVYNGTTFASSLQTEIGVNYLIQYKDDLNTVNWTDLTTIVGDGTVQPFTDPGPLPLTQRFYRVITQP